MAQRTFFVILFLYFLAFSKSQTTDGILGKLNARGLEFGEFVCNGIIALL